MATVKTKTKSKAKIKQSVKNEDPVNLRSDTLEALRMVGRGWYRFSKNLVEIYDNPKTTYQKWGFASFEEYIKREVKAVEYRISLYYIQMGRAIVKHSLTEEQVADLGWTKFKEVSSLFYDAMPSEELDELIDKAKESTFAQVKDFVKEERLTRHGGENVRTTMLQFHLKDEVAEFVKSALGSAMSAANSESMNTGLEVLAHFFMAHFETKDAIAILKELEPEVEQTKVKPKEYANKGKKKAEATT